MIGKLPSRPRLTFQKYFVEVLEGIVDQWIVDIKDMNPEIYRAYTGKDNGQVIINLRHFLEARRR
jgi:pyruvate formate lyase activating enzyme